MDWRIATIKLLGCIVSAVSLPLIMALLSELFPPRPHRLFPNLERLRARNRWIDVVSWLLAFAGIAMPLVLFRGALSDLSWPAAGLGFGFMAMFPYVWVCLVTLPFGLWRYQEFWRYYELEYGIGKTGILLVYLPCAATGAISAIVLFNSGWRF